MKNFKILKTVVLLVAVMAFSSCDEDGPIQQEVKTNQETTIQVNGLKGESAYTISDSADIQDLLDSATEFVEAEIDQVKLRIDGYSGSSIEGNITLKVGAITLFTSQTVSLTDEDTTISIPAAVRDVVTLINGGTFNISLVGTTTTPIADDAFQLIVTPRIRGVFEL